MKLRIARPSARAAGILIGLMGGAHAATAQTIVELRGRDGTLSGAVDRMGADGILLKPDDTSGPRTRWISWDRVRTVKGDRAADAGAFSDIADRLWRARTRMERGDLALAEPDLERLAGTNPPLGGPSGTLLAELLLRSRMVRASHTGAVFAYLRWSAVRHAADGTAALWVGGASTLAPVIERTTNLAWQCPPVFTVTVSTPALQAFIASPDWERLGAIDAATRDLAALYRAAASWEVARRAQASPGPVPEIKSKDPGVELVREVVLSRAGTAEQRQAARDALERRLTAKPTPARGADAENTDGAAPAYWQETWCRLAIGRSLAIEPDAASVRRGVLHLLHIPARFADDQPLVVAGALAEAADALERAGDAASARRLRSEFQRLYPTVALHAAADLNEGPVVTALITTEVP